MASRTDDQTGRESWVRGYYAGRRDGILHYNGKADGGIAVPPGGEAGAPSGDVGELAAQLIVVYGNGDARREALGGHYAEAGRILAGSDPSYGGSVNFDALARAVINGDYGNGDERRERLGADYVAVQARVNDLLA